MQLPVTLVSGSTTSPFLINPDGWVVIEAGAASASVQYTTGTPGDIAAGTATWLTVGSFTGNTAVRADEELADTWVKVTATGGDITYHVEGELSKADRLTLRGYKRTTINNLGAAYSLDATGNVTGLVGPGGTINTLALRTTPVRVATFGDSTANIGGLQVPSSQDISKVSVSTWQSGLVQPILTGEKYYLGSVYPQAYLVANGGISGQTTTQMLARDTLAASSTRYAVTDIINLAPDVVLLRGGSINDITGVTTGTLAATVTAVYANHCQIIQRLLSANIKVIDSGIFGFSGSATDPAATRSALLQLNTLFAAYADQYKDSVVFISPLGVLSDSTGAFLPGISTDGVHLIAQGGYKHGLLEAEAVTRFFGQSTQTRYQGANVVSNAMMANTSVVAFGTVANGFSSISATNCTRQNAKVESINGKSFQTCEAVISATNASLQFILPFDPSATGANMTAPLNLQIGDVYGFEYDYIVQPVSGMSTVSFTEAKRIDIRDAVGSGRIAISVGTASNNVITGAYQGKAVFPPVVFGDVQANLLNTSQFYLQIIVAESSGIFKVGVSNVRIVKLNQPVVTM